MADVEYIPVGGRYEIVQVQHRVVNTPYLE